MKNIPALLAAFLIVCLPQLNAQVELEEKLALADKQIELYAYNLALQSYTEVLQKSPNNVHALAKTGLCYLQLNQPEKSLTFFEKAANSKGFSDDVPFHYGQALMMVGDYARAKVWFKLYSETNAAKGQHYAETCDWAARNTKTESEFSLKSELLNTNFSDFLPAFFGNKVVYSSTRNDIVKKLQTGQSAESWAGGMQPQLFATELDQKSGYLQRPVLLKGELQSSLNEGPVTYSTDGKKVAFCRNNFINGNRQLADEGMNLSMYTADVVNGAWMNIQAFPYNGSDFGTGYPAFSKDGQTLYFASDRPGTGQGGWDLYASEWNGSKWTSPANLGNDINTPGHEIAPSVDENHFYFASDWHAGFGGLDVFACNLVAGSFSGLQNMGTPINSSYDDYGFIYKNVTSTGYLTSSRPGGRGQEDIYRVNRKTQDHLLSVTDASGNAIIGATVDLTACGSSIYATDAQGKYRFSRSVNANACTGRVNYPGYYPAVFDIKGGIAGMVVKLMPIPETKPEPVVVATAPAVKPAPAPARPVESTVVTTTSSPAPVITAERPVTYSTPSSVVAKEVPAPSPVIQGLESTFEFIDGYSVQLVALDKNATATEVSKFNELRKYGNVYVKDADGLKKIRIGVYLTNAEATKTLNALKKTYKGAFIIPESNIDKALVYLSNEPKSTGSATSTISAEVKPVQTAPKPVEASTVASAIPQKVVEKEPELIRTRYAVQFAAHQNDGEAINMSEFIDLTDIGRLYTVPEGSMTRIRLGVWEDPDAAEAARDIAVKRGYKQAIVVNEKSTMMTDKLLLKNKPVEKVVEKPVEMSTPVATKPGTKTTTPAKTAPAKKPATSKTAVEKAVSTEEAPEVTPLEVKKAPAAVYLVRIAAMRDPANFDDAMIQGTYGYKDVRKSGKVSIIYLTGYNKLEDAIEAKKMMSRRGYKDAYVVKQEGAVLTKVEL